MLINMFYLSFSEKYLNLSCVFLFWKEDGGGATKKSLKKFTNVVQFLTDMTPLVCCTSIRVPTSVVSFCCAGGAGAVGGWGVFAVLV